MTPFNSALTPRYVSASAYAGSAEKAARAHAPKGANLYQYTLQVMDVNGLGDTHAVPGDAVWLVPAYDADFQAGAGNRRAWTVGNAQDVGRREAAAAGVVARERADVLRTAAELSCPRGADPVADAQQAAIAALLGKYPAPARESSFTDTRLFRDIPVLADQKAVGRASLQFSIDMTSTMADDPNG